MFRRADRVRERDLVPRDLDIVPGPRNDDAAIGLRPARSGAGSREQRTHHPACVKPHVATLLRVHSLKRRFEPRHTTALTRISAIVSGADGMETEARGGDITLLLASWRDGDRSALERLLPLIHDELNRLARRHLAREQK